MSYIILNGQAVRTDSPVIAHTNRAFRYGDGLFETFLCKGTEPFLFESHYSRMVAAAQALKFDIPLLPAAESLRKQIALLISKKKYPPFSRIRITVFRSEGGLYTPVTNRPEWIIDHEPYIEAPFTLNTNGLLTGIFDRESKIYTSVSRFKTCSSLLFVLAGLWKKENNWDDVLIVNQNNRVIEGLSSNLFWVKNNTIFTPSISSGCVDGVMRKHLISLCEKSHIPVVETDGPTVDELKSADEIFLTNSIQGIRWILGVDKNRFYLKMARELTAQLNKSLL